MRNAALALAVVTLFPILGPICFLLLAGGAIGGSGSISKMVTTQPTWCLQDGALPAFFGLLSAAQAILHFTNHPDTRFGRWQSRMAVTGLITGCAAYIGIAFIDVGAFVWILVVSPILLLPLGLLGMITLRQFDVV